VFVIRKRPMVVGDRRGLNRRLQQASIRVKAFDGGVNHLRELQRVFMIAVPAMAAQTTEVKDVRHNANRRDAVIGWKERHEARVSFRSSSNLADCDRGAGPSRTGLVIACRVLDACRRLLCRLPADDNERDFRVSEGPAIASLILEHETLGDSTHPERRERRDGRQVPFAEHDPAEVRERKSLRQIQRLRGVLPEGDRTRRE